MLIQGDNLEALKALLPFYAGQVKCVYIDPPYNTRSAFEHYDDNLEHSKWLAMMWPRLELLRDLLAEDGSIWVSIDDNEAHYLKVVMDEVFGRKKLHVDNGSLAEELFTPEIQCERHFIGRTTTISWSLQGSAEFLSTRDFGMFFRTSERQNERLTKIQIMILAVHGKQADLSACVTRRKGAGKYSFLR